jgi:hypothetical protein
MTYPERPWWLPFDGGVSTDFGPSTVYTAPSNASSRAMLRAIVRDLHVDVDFKVVEPSGLDHARADAKYSYDPGSYDSGMAGAAMIIYPYLAPTSVSFYRVWGMEVGGPATEVTGYFTNKTSTNLWHKADRPFNVNYQNYFQDTAAGGPFNRINEGWCNGGSVKWVIPFVWQAGGTNGDWHPLDIGGDQYFTMNAIGTMRVTKFNHTAIRMTNEEPSTVIPFP